MVQKTSKWVKDSTVEKQDNVPTDLNSRRTVRRVRQANAVNQKEDGPPDASEYFPFDSQGNEKKDGRKRVMLMIAEDGKSFEPILWFGSNVLEVGMIIAGANQIISLEIANIIMLREKDIQKDQRLAVAAALEKLGIVTPPGDSKDSEEFATDETEEDSE